MGQDSHIGRLRVGVVGHHARDARVFYEATAGDGTYRFYTRARDAAGNYEAAPDVPDAVTAVDTVKPGSAATSPAHSTARSLIVNYAAVDQGAGLKEVELWVRFPGAAGYELSAVDPTPQTPGFDFTATDGDGEYRFYTRARDVAGNYEDAPQSTPDASTSVAWGGTPPTTGPKPQEPAPSVNSPGPQAPSAGAPSSVRLASRSLRLRRGTVTIKLSCAGGAPCRGSVALRTAPSVRVGKRRALRLAKAGFSIPSDTASHVKLRLSKANLRRLDLLRRLKVVVSIDPLTGGQTTYGASLKR